MIQDSKTLDNYYIQETCLKRMNLYDLRSSINKIVDDINYHLFQTEDGSK